MTARVVSFADFSRGEFGDLGPTLPPNVGEGWFTGKNVMVYRDGSVGPRPGLKAFTRVGSDWPNGLLYATVPSTTSTQQTFMHIGTKARQVDKDLTAMELEVISTYGDDTLPAPTEYPSNGSAAPLETWVMIPQDGLYKADFTGDAVTLEETDIDGRAVKFYRNRLIAADNNDVQFSDPGPTGWDDFNDLFTPTTFNIVTGFHELRNGLVITQNGGTMDMVTGTLGTSSSVLRRLSSRTAPLDPYACASIGSEFLVIMGRGLDFPMLYNGATWEELRHLRYAGSLAARTSLANGSIPSNHVLALETGDAWMILSGVVGTGATNRMLLSWNGARTYHTWGATISPFARRFEEGVVLLSDGGAGGAPPEFRAFYPDLDRPAFTSDSYSRPGDLSDTPFDAYMHLPAWHAQEGEEVMVRGVVVHFTKWATGSGSTNHFDLTVDARRRYDATSTVTSATQSFDEAGASASTDGSDVVEHFGFGDQGYGTEFQIKLAAIRGVAIRELTVILEVRPERAT